MAAPIEIRLAGAPQGKGRARFVRSTGVAYTPEKTRTYEAALRLAAQDAMAGREPVETWCEVTIYVFMPVPASWSARKREQALAGIIRPTVKPDWDNFAKTTDALNEIVWRDDKQVCDGRVVKRYGTRPGMVIVVRAEPEPFSLASCARAA